MKSAPLSPLLSLPAAADGFVDAFGGRYYRIADVGRLAPFFMNVVSASDLWLFLTSNGGLTAGRVNAEGALFPYCTVDRLYDAAGLTGPFTAVRAEHAGRTVLWEPFTRHLESAHAVTRHLYKSIEGDRVWFEEIHPELALAFRYGWSTADDHGFIRSCELANLSPVERRVSVLDGLRNFLPPAIDRRLQNDSSCLVDAYKTAEVLTGTSLAVYALSTGITDRPVPVETLLASIVWSQGLAGAAVLLSEDQWPAFVAGRPLATENRRRGIRSLYAVHDTFVLPAHGRQRWMLVADTGLTQHQVAARRSALANPRHADAVRADADAATQRLRALVAAADGLQAGHAEATTAHHFSNTLFNVLRGGLFADGYAIPGPDFADFVRTRNRPAAARHRDFLLGLPPTLPRADLLARLDALGDRDLARLGLEYLPLTFSRRHGDPSRPWNRFNIHVRDAAGARVLNHEGNWRDIFQNWEALCLSYPDYFGGIVAKFLNASTLDGYNPYRIGRSGIEWEVPDHENPWASIGYWGDHQTIYLLKLLEWSDRFHPGQLAGWLRSPLFSYADVPYRISPYDALRRNPHATITFDPARHEEIERRVARDGTDARLLHDAAGVVQAGLAEKLLLLALTRLTNFVPGGGIWMNTQRPEWNDANNALVGYGVSVVTLGYLRRFLVHLRDTLFPSLGHEPVPVSAALAALARRVTAALAMHRSLLDTAEIDDRARRTLLDALAGAGSDYRSGIYERGPGAPTALAVDEISELVKLALAFVDHTLRANRRPDGLYHAYNLIEFTENPPALRLQRLAPMLEGQVAILSAGLLAPAECAALLQALRDSPLYRPDQHSYLLYPDRPFPGFLARNVLPADAVAGCPLLAQLLAAGDTRLVARDVDGCVRFAADLVNVAALDDRLAALGADPAWNAAVAAGADQVRALYEGVFHHRAYTGRSGSMFGYEGLGCIYWHMVAKLLLAVQENLDAALAAGDPAAPELVRRYYDLRAGLGFSKSPAVYGAFPTDPYSHTPGHAGAQQPGMTGQVKEEILTRFGELGVHIADGRIAFRPRYLQADEFTRAPGEFRYIDASGNDATLPLPARSIAFTFCGVPVVYRTSSAPRRLRVTRTNGEPRVVVLETGEFDRSLSRELFARSGQIQKIEVELGPDFASFSP